VRRGGALLVLATAVLAAGCGTGGISKAGDPDKGKQLFLAKCGGCHTLADAGTHGTQGPDLDDAFEPSRKQGFEEVTIEQVVRDQIELAVPPMPQDLVTGADADAVAAYVASVAGKPTAAKSSTNGKDIFVANCGSCHTLSKAGTSGTIGPSLEDLRIGPAAVERQIREGGGGMPPFEEQLSDAQIEALVQYLTGSGG
jgi:cbb3-type cytochrome c oxidase subunit III